MNRCPSCHYLVPAGWITCRRCGAALPVARPSHRQSALPIPESAKLAWAGVAVTDTILPELPRAPAPRAASGRRAIAFAAAEMLTLALATTTLVGAQSTDFGQAEAVARLRSTAHDARAFYAHRHTFAGLRHAHDVDIVGPTKVATVTEVSMRTRTPSTIVLATPTRPGTCVFGRSSTHESMGFVVTHGRACRAAAAPSRGWTT